MSTLNKVNTFLREFKILVASQPQDDVYDAGREKNRQALLNLGINKLERRNTILEISATDFHEGPLRDRDRPGEVWIFGCLVSGKEVYVKLKISGSGDDRKPLCLSFHAAEHPLTYPLKKK